MPDPLLAELDRVQASRGRAGGGTPDPLLSLLDAVQSSADTRSMGARAFDAVFTPPAAVTAAFGRRADAIDAPTPHRGRLRAQVEGFAAGALEGVGSLLPPGDVTLTALGLGPLARVVRGARGGAQAVSALQQGANVATVGRGVERIADADSLTEGVAGVAQAALGSAGALGGRSPVAAPTR